SRTRHVLRPSLAHGRSGGGRGRRAERVLRGRGAARHGEHPPPVPHPGHVPASPRAPRRDARPLAALAASGRRPNAAPSSAHLPAFSTASASASVYVMSTMSPTWTASSLLGSLTLIVVRFPRGPRRVTVEAVLSMPSIVARTVTVSVTLPEGFSPSGARLTSVLAPTPGCDEPGLFTW